MTSLNDKDKGLRVAPLQYVIQRGQQTEQVTYDNLRTGEGFKIDQTVLEKNQYSVQSADNDDLIGKIVEGTLLTRRTVAEILKG